MITKMRAGLIQMIPLKIFKTSFPFDSIAFVKIIMEVRQTPAPEMNRKNPGPGSFGAPRSKWRTE